jgi:hypothetical protein
VAAYSLSVDLLRRTVIVTPAIVCYIKTNQLLLGNAQGGFRMQRSVMTSAKDDLTTQVREAGYRLIKHEQLRTNRWLVVAESDEGRVLIMAQQRRTISASDVQDLAELLRLDRFQIGYLLAIGGRFTAEAQSTAAELRRPQIVLCSKLPPADHPPRLTTVFEMA